MVESVDQKLGQAESSFHPHTSHWGVFSARMTGDELEVRPHPGDPDPNQIIQNFPAALRHRARIAQPMVRKGWLENGPAPDDRRGRDEFVPVSWETALDLLGKELARIRDGAGPGAIFGGSYGWSSAGRFHHAQSQIHRFLNVVCGGYVRSVTIYSSGSSQVLIPHIIGDHEGLTKRNVSWEQIAEHTDIVVAFGGMALKNSMVAGGSVSKHVERGAMQRAAERGCNFVLVSPMRTDLPEEANAEWVSCVPGSDTALMMAIVRTLVVEGKHDRAFLERYTSGWPIFERYLLGKTDGQPKDAAWAAALGQIGLPGGGYGYALGAIAYYGRRYNAVPIPTLSQERNGISDFIPVARIADMLLHPGEVYRFNGETRTYPEIKLVYWAGGNPFHHHQDLNRLRKAFAQLDTLVVHELAWTATARHADVVLPCTMTLEREDIGANSNDPLLVPMHPVAPPYGQARDDYAIFADLAERLGARAAFTEGRSVRQWLEHLYEQTRAGLAEKGLPAPSFDEFWAGEGLLMPQQPDDGGYLRAFRNDPDANPLPTPSGKLQIYSETIASFGEADCPGHPTWLGPVYVPTETAPYVLISNQPRTRLHSQLDFGGHSVASKHRGREVATMHPDDAAARGISEGDIIRMFNERGACLAGVTLSGGVRRGVIQLATGAWYDPADLNEEKPLCVHGNPNVLTPDIGTSALAQGCTGQLTTVQVERFEGNLPEIRAFDPPM